MPRPKNFDIEQTLERAVGIFWRKGYAATSIQDLLDEMGLNRGSLYATYGGKRRLFATAVDRYRQDVVAPRLVAMESETAGLSEIRNFFEAFLERVRSGHSRYGCLMTNTCVELAPHDPAMAAKARQNLARIEGAFTQALRCAQARDELNGNLNPQALGRFLTATLQGLQVMTKAGLPIAHLEDVVRTALATLEP
ncbi:MAG: TetR/AcrR family transcriptional regulator [Proteobacteria bacterium]|nr:MAG: TetR/AcrR family transcriptional regulator [Pseudomonadota bacterium]QKK12372.1 MAG: TetR/AcrR family transcriptional regulator [Pseudomonadota bacterium]